MAQLPDYGVQTAVTYGTASPVVYFRLETVPEPATATLSLLALAALAARRRRKR